MKPLPKETIEFYKKSPEMLAVRKLLFAECVEDYIRSKRKVIVDEQPSEVAKQTAYIAEWCRMYTLPFNQAELDFYHKWIKRFDVMYSYGMLPQIEDVYAQKISG